jgi:putative transposase
VILFSNDLELSYQQIKDWYSLRFQIEFNFRDAKQYFGLSDFKNTGQEQVTNAINLAMFMTLLSKILLKKYRVIFGNDRFSINDLKALYRGYMYVEKIIKRGAEIQTPIINSDTNFDDIINIGAINKKSA